MERIRYQLAHPIETIDRTGASEKRTTITDLLLAPRVKGRHMRATDAARGPVEAKLLLISSLAGITRAEADELDEADVLRIDALYDEDSDLMTIARDLDLPAETPVPIIRAAITELMVQKGLHVPLDGGAEPSDDGPATGPRLSAI